MDSSRSGGQPVRWWRRRPGGRHTLLQSPSSPEDHNIPTPPRNIDAETAWRDLFQNSALRLLDIHHKMSKAIDVAIQGQADHEALDNLYRLDELRCQAQRFVENMHVLTGRSLLDADRQVTSLMDVMQAAQGRISNWRRITVGQAPDIAVDEYICGDMIRVVTELLDNAVRFSPSETRVNASAHLLADGGALVRIQDEGIGIPAGKLEQLNAILQRPTAQTMPVPGSPVQQGFRLIQQTVSEYGVQVSLCARQPRGTVAHVYIPPGLLTELPLDDLPSRIEPSKRSASADFDQMTQQPASQPIRHKPSAEAEAGQVEDRANNPDGSVPTPLPVRVPQPLRDNTFTHSAAERGYAFNHNDAIRQLAAFDAAIGGTNSEGAPR